jgi:ferrochelatase
MLLEHGTDGEMPLVRETRALAELLGADHCFQYGSSPTPHEALATIAARGETEVRVVPLYPQRAGATVEAAIVKVKQAAKAFPQLKLRYHAEGFATEERWVAAWAQAIQEAFENADVPVTDLVFSFHGYPEARILAGDPYQRDCEASVKAIVGALRATPKHSLTPILAYQSRFGRTRWIGPSTESVLRDLGKQGASVLIACPSFVSENLETLVEVDSDLRRVFEEAGGKGWARAFLATYTVIPTTQFSYNK